MLKINMETNERDNAARIPKLFNGNSSLTGIMIDESPLAKFDKVRDLRRKSEMMRNKNGNEDS